MLRIALYSRGNKKKSCSWPWRVQGGAKTIKCDECAGCCEEGPQDFQGEGESRGDPRPAEEVERGRGMNKLHRGGGS